MTQQNRTDREGPALRVLSLGWGVQSWTVAAMMALDELPRVDFLIHADTHHERAETYAFAQAWTPWLQDHGLNVVTVSSDRTEAVREDWSGSVTIPAFTEDAETGHQGQVRRQCTHDWKIMPVRRFVREEMQRRDLKCQNGSVECWMGISLDEWSRMRTSDAAYITNVYPLVDRRMSRADCHAWLTAHDLPTPPKSSCTFCPYRSVASWKALKRDGGPDWQEAVAVDFAIRDKRPPHALYVHPGRKPLEEAVTIPEDFGASQLGFEQEQPCDSGFCWT